MARPQTGAIDRVVIAALQADAELVALMPEGVYFGIAAPGLTRFVLVTLQTGADDGVYGHRAQEEITYAVQAIGLSRDTTLGTMRSAAARIDAVLEGVPLATPVDYGSIDCVREEPIADTVIDELDKSLRWHHFGGMYRVTAYWPDVVTLTNTSQGSHP